MEKENRDIFTIEFALWIAKNDYHREHYYKYEHFEELLNEFKKNNNMTAVEFLVKETPNIHWEDGYWADLFEQAKELEKQHIIDARVNGVAEGIEISDKTITEDISKNHEIYYNETFKKEIRL
jgi:hypothetical protein